jgi:thiol:disulfide interchange protein DsbC
MDRIFCGKAIVVGAVFALAGNCSGNEANEHKTDTGTQSAKVVSLLGKTIPALKINSVRDTPVAGVEEINFTDGQRIYSINGSEYFIKGDLYKVSSEGIVNITEEILKGTRIEMLKSLKPEDTITYSPKAEKRSAITVFTDTDCGYCQKLHKEVPALNSMGIEVRYLAFPRGGPLSVTAEELSSAWCSPDKQNALNKLTSREKIPSTTCNENPVAGQYAMGISLGVSATPAIVMPDGTLVLGYQSASDLKKVLGL